MIPIRDDTPTNTRPVVTVALIVACVLVFLWQVAQQEVIGFKLAVYSFGVIPTVLLSGDQLPRELTLVPSVMTLLTHLFLHGGWIHLIGNMLYLWIFGNNVEDAMGHGRFVVFYLLCGIAAALGQAQVDPASTIPMIGASGAIAGVLGAYLLLYPHARILVALHLIIFVKLVRVPAGAVLSFWFVFQLVNSMYADYQQGGVAWLAHIGGFITGMVLILIFKRRNVQLFHPAHHYKSWHDHYE